MYCCACCKYFRNDEKEVSEGYCFIDGTEVRLEDVCDEFKIQEVKEGKRGNKMTNREWLNSLSDEELAEFLNLGNCQLCSCERGSDMCDDISCTEGIFQWLNQEKYPMPEIKVGDIVDTIHYALVAIDHNVFVRSATKERMMLNDVGEIKRIWRLSSESEYEMIWRADNGIE